jgi:hypothetical protein
MINFTNSGEIDIRAATVLGVNAKFAANSIGFFGTGLKYAIAGVLRLGGNIEILSGMRRFTFQPAPAEVRGKIFQFIQCQETDEGGSTVTFTLGFTTELGKTWKPWMLLRELYSNMFDEGGVSCRAPRPPAPNLTQIQIQCQALEELELSSFLLQSKAIWAAHSLEIHPALPLCGKIYVKGIYVGSPATPANFSYNFPSGGITLTEDRTILYPWQIVDEVCAAVSAQLKDVKLLRKYLLPQQGSWESALRLTLMSEDITAEAKVCYAKHAAKINSNLYNILRAESARNIARKSNGTAFQRTMLTKAKEFLLQHLGADLSECTILIIPLGADVLGMADCKNNEISLDPQTFERGTQILVETLYEEFLHIEYGFRDESRAFQDFLLRKAITLAVQNSGQPL